MLLISIKFLTLHVFTTLATAVFLTGEFDLKSMYFNPLLHCMCTWDEPVILTGSQSYRDGLRERFTEGWEGGFSFITVVVV